MTPKVQFPQLIGVALHERIGITPVTVYVSRGLTRGEAHVRHVEPVGQGGGIYLTCRTDIIGDFSFFSLFSLIFIADGPHHYHPAYGHPISPRFTPYNFLSRCRFSTLTTRQPMVEFYLLTFPRFPIRKKEHKSYFGKNRIHDFRTTRCAGYLLDYSDDCGGINCFRNKRACIKV